MDQQATNQEAAQNRTAIERKGDRELVVTRTFDAPAHLVFRAWSEAELFRQWWVPKGAPRTLVACEMDVRTGGTYRLEFGAGGQTMAFYGKYIEVVPNERIVSTNEEEADGAVTTVTFQDVGGKTLLTFHETYPNSDALEEAMQGAAAGLPQQLDQLEELLPQLAA
ncbi:MAG TPA: SRPBCC family protein [Sphingomicrobium sp.]|jgi:uncharacterized protein YndB with AHSA1/START domain